MYVEYQTRWFRLLPVPHWDFLIKFVCKLNLVRSDWAGQLDRPLAWGECISCLGLGRDVVYVAGWPGTLSDLLSHFTIPPARVSGCHLRRPLTGSSFKFGKGWLQLLSSYVFLDVCISRVVLWTRFPELLLTTAYQLYSSGVPRTAENIRQFCTEEHWWVLQLQNQAIFLNQGARSRKGKGSTSLGYNKSTSHRVIKVFKPGAPFSISNVKYWPGFIGL
jgi:hypothetical protein